LPHTNLVDVPFEKLDSLTASRRKWHFGKHENSLTDLWRPSYSPQSGMTKFHFRPRSSSATLIRGSSVCPRQKGKVRNAD
jgi:hypothetical protein